MCVLCMFNVDWEMGGRKKLKCRDFFRVGLQETNYFFRPNEGENYSTLALEEIR